MADSNRCHGWCHVSENQELVLDCSQSPILCSLFFSEFTEVVNRELSSVATWLKANKLTLNPEKTMFFLFHPSRKKINLDDLSASTV